MNPKEIVSLAIYPPIGIARIGNSDEYFLASDEPGVAPKSPGGYKDSEGRVKKQVARFRIYAFDKRGKVLGEINANDAKINWRVHVANVKSAWYEFNNALDLPEAGIPSAFRNADVSGDDRKQLVINPGSKSITGTNTKGKKYQLDQGEFYGTKVPLGHLETDNEGRLLFFGGDGDAASKNNLPAITFANNDGFHDDTCDGVVRASVVINGKKIEAEPAMVAVTPPNFGPGLFGVVTMNDVVQDLFIREMNYPDPAQNGVDFWEHIFPILSRMTETQWVNSGFFMLFGKNSPSDFTDPKLIKLLSDTSKKAMPARKRVFNWFRNPSSDEYTPAKVPPFYGDGFGEYTKIALVDLPITQTQYARLEEWSKGNFTVQKPKPRIPFNKMTPAQQIDALNQAPLEECLGGPFHPGIELTWPLRVKLMWKEAYRLNVISEKKFTKLNYGPLLSPAIALGPKGPLSASGPGSLTRWLGVPWQTDEASCLSGYDPSTYLPLPSFWAARVPNQVLSEDSYARMQDDEVNIAQRLKHFDYRQDWLRDFGTNYQKKINSMIAEWHELGIITKIEGKTPDNIKGFLPDVVWKETGRHFSENDPTLKQVIYAENQKVPSFKAAEDMLESFKPPAPKRDRKRTTFGRGER
ncbi:MAG: LodA/GoxA family CTQ-dependent oxidase [Saprospiraceae bacterium]|nr:LodA/GoxA family CTQ-dependent oxidase [Saprospiraceae bacterium]